MRTRGSIHQGNFGWFGKVPELRSGNEPETLVVEMGSAHSMGHHVSLGFECPLFVPVADKARSLMSRAPVMESRAISVRIDMTGCTANSSRDPTAARMSAERNCRQFICTSWGRREGWEKDH